MDARTRQKEMERVRALLSQTPDAAAVAAFPEDADARAQFVRGAGDAANRSALGQQGSAYGYGVAWYLEKTRARDYLAAMEANAPLDPME